MIDRNYFKVVKEHTWLDGFSLYLLKGFNNLYFVIVESANERTLETYSSFDRALATTKYGEWKDRLMKNHTEWFEEIQ